MENDQHFTSPIKAYVAQQLQVSFQFGKKYAEKIIETFEMPLARYKVCSVTCYNLEPDGKKSFSSEWYEVYDTAHPELIDGEEVFSGDAEELADYLLKLDEHRELFSYQGRDDKDEGDDCFFLYKPLRRKETSFLDDLIKQKLDALYRR